MTTLTFDKTLSSQHQDDNESYIVLKKDCVLVNTFISNDDPYKNLQDYMVDEIYFE
jgi:hypothetical protein